MELEKLKTEIRNKVDSISKDLIDLSHRIHDNPELGYQEEKAAKWLADYLEN